MYVLATLLASANLVLAFGTVNPATPPFGQNREHERITRAALACRGPKTPDCFEEKSLDQLAGHLFYFGAVGDPDKPRSLLKNPLADDYVEGPLAHCDDADFLDESGYPQSRRDAGFAMISCILHLRKRVTEGIDAALGILDVNNMIDKLQVRQMECAFQDHASDSAKCQALQGFGRSLHGVQDFYSHSNWADLPGPGSLSPENPPGLHQKSLAPILNLRARVDFDFENKLSVLYGLSTGCYAGALKDKEDPVKKAKTRCNGRITHASLDKDTGDIDWESRKTSSPSTSRGKIANNFDDAVQSAIEDTKRQWLNFRHALEGEYGAFRANRIACAMTHDDPARHCQGNRKLGIVIDSSGSNTQTDPKNLRISAAIEFNKRLVTQKDAGADGLADLVTVVDFDYSAKIVYPLGDPEGAAAAISKIDSDGGTSIYTGLRAAIDEIDRDQGVPTNGRSGIIVLTDGQDGGSATLLTQEVDRATKLGIRVWFGFLSPPTVKRKRFEQLESRQSSTSATTALQQAILASGGMYSTITSAEAQQSFIELVLGRGATATDNNMGISVLKPGLAVVSNIDSSKNSEYFIYRGSANQRMNATIKLVDSKAGANLDISLLDVVRNTQVASATTDSNGKASIILDTACDRDLELAVGLQAGSSGSFLFSVELQVADSQGSHNDPDGCVLNLSGPAPDNPLRYIGNSTSNDTDTSISTTSVTYPNVTTPTSTSSNDVNAMNSTLAPTIPSTSPVYNPSASTDSTTSDGQLDANWHAWIGSIETATRPSLPGNSDIAKDSNDESTSHYGNAEADPFAPLWSAWDASVATTVDSTKPWPNAHTSSLVKTAESSKTTTSNDDGHYDYVDGSGYSYPLRSSSSPSNTADPSWSTWDGVRYTSGTASDIYTHASWTSATVWSATSNIPGVQSYPAANSTTAGGSVGTSGSNSTKVNPAKYTGTANGPAGRMGALYMSAVTAGFLFVSILFM